MQFKLQNSTISYASTLLNSEEQSLICISLRSEMLVSEMFRLCPWATQPTIPLLLTTMTKLVSRAEQTKLIVTSPVCNRMHPFSGSWNPSVRSASHGSLEADSEQRTLQWTMIRRNQGAKRRLRECGQKGIVAWQADTIVQPQEGSADAAHSTGTECPWESF